MQGCVIQVRLLRSMHAQDQQKQALQSQFRKKLPKAVGFYNIEKCRNCKAEKSFRKEEKS